MKIILVVSFVLQVRVREKWRGSIRRFFVPRNWHRVVFCLGSD